MDNYYKRKNYKVTDFIRSKSLLTIIQVGLISQCFVNGCLFENLIWEGADDCEHALMAMVEIEEVDNKLSLTFVRVSDTNDLQILASICEAADQKLISIAQMKKPSILGIRKTI